MAQAEEHQQDRIVQRLREYDPQSIAEVLEYRGERTLVVPRTHLRRVGELLRDEPELAFNFLSDISAVDRFPVEPRFELNYHLLSIPAKFQVPAPPQRITLTPQLDTRGVKALRLRVRVHAADPLVPSLVPVWPTANWHEREIFDLFGLRFEGHPDLRRIFMPNDWEGYPLRKDYPTTGPR
jgi:NADH-quinone oxidoreductase subunit C